MLKRALGITLLLALMLGGCGNPAEDKPEAKVSEAKEATTPPPPAAEAKTYAFNSEASTVNFVGSKVTGKHDGGFKTFKGTIVMTGNDPSSIQVEIDATSIWADNERLTGHLKSPDFFDAETHPTAQFTSHSIVREGAGYSVTGNLMLHGVTKSITFPATITATPEGVTAQSEFVLKRFDWNIAYTGKADDLIRDEVVVTLNIAAKPQTDSTL